MEFQFLSRWFSLARLTGEAILQVCQMGSCSVTQMGTRGPRHRESPETRLPSVRSCRSPEKPGHLLVTYKGSGRGCWDSDKPRPLQLEQASLGCQGILSHFLVPPRERYLPLGSNS